MAEGTRRPRTLLEDLGLDLTHLAAMLAHHAEQDARRGEGAATAAADDPRRLLRHLSHFDI
jgi:hypothetical protein